MFTSVGFIGSGEVAGALAPHLATAGVPVLISNSRGPANLTDTVIEFGDQAHAVTVTGADGVALDPDHNYFVVLKVDYAR